MKLAEYKPRVDKTTGSLCLLLCSVVSSLILAANALADHAVGAEDLPMLRIFQKPPPPSSDSDFILSSYYTLNAILTPAPLTTTDSSKQKRTTTLLHIQAAVYSITVSYWHSSTTHIYHAPLFNSHSPFNSTPCLQPTKSPSTSPSALGSPSNAT